MGNYFLKCTLYFTLHTPLLTPEHLKKAMSGINKNHFKCFTVSMHRNHGYQKPVQSIKSSFKNVYDRFPP